MPPHGERIHPEEAGVAHRADVAAEQQHDLRLVRVDQDQTPEQEDGEQNSRDGREPVARGGPDEASNWVCASMVTNQAKLNWTREELGRTLKPAGNYSEWDGLTGWFCEYVSNHTGWLEESYLRRWHSAARRVRDAA